MIIADRLKALCESKKLSQGDIEKRTGLLRCYISRVENGHTIPAIET
jgi:transcriptional regulator with XRE-family HTH domain